MRGSGAMLMLFASDRARRLCGDVSMPGPGAKRAALLPECPARGCLRGLRTPRPHIPAPAIESAPYAGADDAHLLPAPEVRRVRQQERREGDSARYGGGRAVRGWRVD